MAFLIITESKTGDAQMAAWIGVVFGFLNYGFGIPAYWLEERVGRATLLLIGLPNMAWMMLGLAFSFNIHPDNPARRKLIYVSLRSILIIIPLTL